jgi:hypothetical protein
MDEQIHVLLTSVLVGDEWSALRPGRFTPVKEHPVPIGYEAGWAPGPFWTIWRSEHFLPHRESNFHPVVAQSAVSRYTDCAM